MLEILVVLAVVVPGLALFALASWTIPRRQISLPPGARARRAELEAPEAAPQGANRGEGSGEAGDRAREAA